MLRTTLAAVSLLAMATAVPALADQEVIVRANRLSAYQGDTAFTAVNLTRDELGRTGLDQALKRETEAALFRRQPSLTANPTVQGVGLRAIGPSGAGRALVTLDGVPQNDPFGNWVIWAAIPQDPISHVHVVKGAGGGAYGAGALTGVIDMSLTPPQPGAAMVSGTIGEDGNLRGETDLTVGPVGIDYTDQTVHGDVPVRGSQRGAADIATYGRDRALFANTQFALCRTQNCGELAIMAGSYNSRRDTGLKGATAISSGDQVAVSLTKQPTADQNGWRVQLWHRDSGLSNTSVSVAAGRTSTTLANNQVATPATGDGFNAALRHQSGGTEWEIGVDARRVEGESREYYKYVSGSPTRYRVSGGASDLAGLYAEGSHTTGVLMLSGAIRVDDWRAYDGHRTETDTATGLPTLQLSPADQQKTVVSARLGATYALSTTTTARIAAYTGFRPPSLNELYRPFRVGNDVTEANAALRPETLKGAEIGLRSGDSKTFVDVDVFANTLSDPITNVTVALGPFTSPTAGFIPAGGSLRQRQNVGEIRAYGLEGRARYAITDTLALTSSLTLTHARVAEAGPTVNGLRPAEAPEIAGSLGLETSWRKATLHADWLYEGKTFDDDLNTLALKPSHSLALDLDYPLAQHVTLTVSVDNALDDAIQVTHAGDGTIGYDTGRRISVGLTWRR